VSWLVKRHSVRTKVTLGAVMVVSVLAVAFVAGLEPNGRVDGLAGGSPIRVNAALTPRTHLFGDTVTARISIAADRRRVEPGSVRIDGSFGAYTVVAAPALERREGEATEYVVWTVRLRCLKSACVSGKAGRRVVFAPARVRYSVADGNSETASSVSVDWPALTVYSRVDQLEVAALDPRGEPPWRADLVPLPDVSYSTPPLLLAGLFFGAGSVLLLGAVALLAPRARPETPEAPTIAVPAGARLSPFERALMLLEDDSDGAVESRRQALELVAAEFGQRGEREQELSARRLAWAEEFPPFADTRALVQSARSLSEEGGNGSEG